jgi:cellobiose transport system permease protein
MSKLSKATKATSGVSDNARHGNNTGNNGNDGTDYGVPALEQAYGKGVARAAARARAKKLGLTSEGRQPGWPSYLILVVTILIFVFPLYYAVSIASQNSPSNQYGVRALIPGSALLTNIGRAFDAIDFWQALGGTSSSRRWFPSRPCSSARWPAIPSPNCISAGAVFCSPSWWRR